MKALIHTLFASALAAGLALPAQADTLAFVEGSSEYQSGKPKMRIYKLVDGKPTTTWCADPSDEKPRLVFGFRKKTKITEIGVVVGELKGGELNKVKARARVIKVSDENMVRELEFEDVPKLQSLKLSPAVNATYLMLDISGLYAGATDRAPICISEIELKSGSRNITGSSVGTKLRGLSTPQRRLLHSWVDQIGAPEKTLLLALDGSFTFTYAPLMEGRPVKLVGKWSAGHRYITLEWRDKKYALKKTLTEIEDDEGRSKQLTLKGDAPHSALAGTYRVAPVRVNF